MNLLRICRIVAIIALAVALCFGGYSHAADVFPGFDLCVTPPDSNTTITFGILDECLPIPPDFFGPGSDPFEGTVVFEGSPLETGPAYVLGATNVIFERLEMAELPICGSSDVIDIEIIALSLVSVSPITVTYFGGMDPVLWDVQMCLSSFSPQPIGTMTISQDCESGGTFTAGLPIVPKFIFTRVDPPHSQFILDDGTTRAYFTETGHWLYVDPGFGVIISPGGVAVDHDCNGSLDVIVGPGSNFFTGLYANPCDCFSPPLSFDMLMTYWYSDCGSLGCLPTTASPYDVPPGVDLCTTPPDSNTYVEFSGPDCPPIPAGFFGPGSDPFEGTVIAEGLPLETVPADTLGDTDAILRRLEPAFLPFCGASDDVAIQVVALSLVSVSPIEVTYDGGIEIKLWDVHVCLSSLVPQPAGSMTINLDCESGGTFSAGVPVIPKFIFTMIDPPHTEMILDYGETPQSIIFLTNSGHWMNFDPGFNVVTSPGGVLTDHDCDGTLDAVIGPSSPNFYSGLYALPCNCFTPPSSYDMFMTYWFSDCASHGCLPPVSASALYGYLPGDVNMSAGTWPAAATGPDVTYLVNYFRGAPTSHSCLLGGFWCSADANGDCNIIGSDVTKLVNVFRGIGSILYCADCEPIWPTPGDLPAEAPPSWPGCE